MTTLRLALLTVALAGCSASADNAGKKAGAVPEDVRTRVEIAVIEPTGARLDLELPGEVEGFRDSLLASALGGYVERVAAHRGQSVQRGALIASVDTATHAAGLEQAQAQAELAEAELQRLKKLGDLASPQQIQQAETQAKVAEATASQARVRLARARITAPFEGVVADVAVEQGEVAAPSAPVARLVELDPVKVSLSVADRDIVALKTGMEVTVTTTATSRVWTGEITHVGPAADMRTRAFPVEVTVDNPDKALLPGMIARVAIQRDVADGVVLPQDWVITRREGSGVFVDEDGVARWRPVELGPVVHDQIVVDSGLEVGERVVMRGHRDLLDGDKLLVAREGTCCDNGRPVFGN